mgnify:CR=1 FL=1
MNLENVKKDIKIRENFLKGETLDLEYVKERKEKLLRFKKELEMQIKN